MKMQIYHIKEGFRYGGFCHLICVQCIVTCKLYSASYVVVVVIVYTSMAYVVMLMICEKVCTIFKGFCCSFTLFLGCFWGCLHIKWS